MIYKGNEIMARVYGSYSDLFSLKPNGELDTSQDIKIEHNDHEVVWYEVVGMEHLRCSLGPFVEIPTIEEAKRRIDAYALENPE